MNYKQVQRYIRLTELVPDLQKMVDEKQLSFTPAVEISFIRPKHQKYIAVAIEGQASSPSLSQAQKMRELDKEGKLNGDVIDGTMKRPGFQKMIAAIEAGYISAVFVKDLSRLGRNYIEVGKLTEEFFPLHDVRLVAVSDGVDSDEGEDDFTPFKNIMNDRLA